MDRISEDGWTQNGKQIWVSVLSLLTQNALLQDLKQDYQI